MHFDQLEGTRVFNVVAAQEKVTQSKPFHSKKKGKEVQCVETCLLFSVALAWESKTWIHVFQRRMMLNILQYGQTKIVHLLDFNMPRK